MEWLSNILDALRDLFPRTFTILPDEAGVRITFGTRVTPLPAGWYWYWPVIQHVEKMSVTPQVVDLRPQSVLCQDVQDMIISGAVMYRVSDVHKAILNVQDYDRSVQVLSLGVIAEFMQEHAPTVPINAIREEVLTRIREEAAGFGLKIMKVYITDLGHAKNLRVLGGDVPIVYEPED